MHFLSNLTMGQILMGLAVLAGIVLLFKGMNTPSRNNGAAMGPQNGMGPQQGGLFNRGNNMGQPGMMNNMQQPGMMNRTPQQGMMGNQYGQQQSGMMNNQYGQQTGMNNQYGQNQYGQNGQNGMYR